MQFNFDFFGVSLVWLFVLDIFCLGLVLLVFWLFFFFKVGFADYNTSYLFDRYLIDRFDR